MRIGLACLFLGGLLPAAALAQTNDPFVESATGLTFPAQVGRFQRTGSITFPDPRQGVAVRYEGPGRGEVFVYDLGLAEIPTGVDSEAVGNAFAQSEAGVEQLLAMPPASAGKKFAESTPVIQNEGRVAKLRVGLYSWTYSAPDGTKGPMATWVLVTGFKNKIVKVLYTAPSLDPMAAQGDLKELIVGLLEANPRERGKFFVEKKAP